MRKFYLYCLMTCLSLTSYAQLFNYSILNQGAQYFTDGEEVYHLKIDLKQMFNGLNVYQPNRQPISFCSKDSLSWLSHAVDPSGLVNSGISDLYQSGILRVNGLSIRNLSKKGDTSLAKTFEDGNKLWCKVKEVTKESFLGWNDSVKTITFYLQDPSSKPEQMVYDSLYFKISKNYGIIETRLVEIEQRNGRLTLNSGLVGAKLKLIGTEKGNRGWLPVSDSLIYNYEIGDEFHYESSLKGTIFYPFCTSSSKTINRVLSKTRVKDSVIYSIDQSIASYTYGCSTTSTYTRDTVTLKYHSTGQPIPLNQWHIENELNRTQSYMYYQKASSKDSLVYKVPQECSPYGGVSTLAKGIGLVAYLAPTANGNIDKTDLVYYKKGAKEWGVKLVLGTENESEPFNAMLHPNPSSGSFSLYLSKPNLKLEVFAANGAHKMTVENLEEGLNNISTNNLGAGLYLYRILQGGKVIKADKLVVQ